MKASPNYRVLNSRKHVNNHNGVISARESVPIPQNIYDNNTSSTSVQHLSHLPDISLSPKDKRVKNKNKSVDRSAISDESNSLKKLELLPKINNPRAENRLKSLIQLLDKKNPALLKAKDRSDTTKSPKTDRNISLDGIEKDRKESLLPSLPSLSTRPSEREEVGDVKKMVTKSPRKIVFKVVKEAESVEPTQSKKPSPKYLAPIHNSRGQKPENREDVSVEIRKKKTKNIFSGNKSEEDSLDKAEVNNNVRKEITGKKREVPEPAVDFEYRVHKLSIDDALERLNQLTNQSKNARKDLFKIQENALAIRLSYERNHRSLNQINSEKNVRVH